MQNRATHATACRRDGSTAAAWQTGREERSIERVDFARWTLLAACAVSLAWAEDEAPSPGGVETLDSVAKTIFDALQSGDMKRMSLLLPLTADIEWLSKQPDAVSFDDESAEATATRYRRATLNMVRVARADSRLDWSKAVLTGLTRTDIYGDQGTLSFGLAVR